MHWTLPTIAILMLMLPNTIHAEEKTELLMEVPQLAERLAAESQAPSPLVVLDVRSADAFAEGHIHGALHVDTKEWKSTFGQGDDTAAWTSRIGRYLPSNNTTVVVVDTKVSPSAARVWWMLKYWGVDDVRVLNGGMQAWRAAEQSLSTDTPSFVESSTFKATAQPERFADYAEVRAIADSDQAATCLIDTRTDQENEAGYIPTAHHLNWEELVDADTGKLLEINQLKQLLERVHFDPAKPTVTYCGGGGRAAVMALAVELATGKPAANYHGSWGDWTKREASGGLPAELSFGSATAGDTPEQCPEE
ncbi:sulfurtransferase [Aeoliella mucimassa]|uniref:Thiosulfate sulfurtransferase SseA n=1 Tax=Aeoliella mucimassa TaxID=2527972 RepID=A0A518AU15_9BACT|nr:rhodanese-like domain-containing protein [Aeoliella mucimassa]QDU58220.1 Putative thiosulfate sulfurtransferase SseA [Aeoliella mucimassa]